MWDERGQSRSSITTSSYPESSLAPVLSFSDHVDYVSGFAFLNDKKTLVSGSGDGTINVYDVRKNKCRASSDPLEDDIFNISFIKNGKRLICGMGDGSMNIFAWDMWLHPTDRLIGHPTSIDSLVILDDDEGIACTGASDGFIRMVQLQPNKFLGLVADANVTVQEEHGVHSIVDQEAETELPVASLALSSDGAWLASGSHDRYVHFWNEHTCLAYVDDRSLSDEASDCESITAAPLPCLNEQREALSSNLSDSDMASKVKSTKRKKVQKTKDAMRRQQAFRTGLKRHHENAAFFADLLGGSEAHPAHQ